MKKLPSYSIIELIVVMLIATIVIATAYQGYLMFFRQYLAFKERSEKIARVSLFDRLLTSDMEDSREARMRNASLHCIYPDKNILYEFRTNCIIRYQENLPDTFYMNAGTPVFYFNELPTLEGKLVDRLEFTVERDKDSIDFSYEKKYGADVLLNENENLIP